MTDSGTTHPSDTSAGKKAPVLLLGLDASEIELIDHYVSLGKMPHMAALRQRGFAGRLQTRPQQFLSIVWTTAFTSTGLDQHGWYFNKQWNPEKQQIQSPDTQWLPRTPFWEDLDEHYKVALFDVPYGVDTPVREQQMSINGWQCHDDFGKVIKPESLKKRLLDKFGKSVMGPEVFGPQTASTLLDMRTEALATANQFSDMVIELVGQLDRDLTFAVLGSIHRGTHYLWDTTQLHKHDVSAEEQRILEGAREDCYVAMDNALGKIVDAIPADTRLFAFALHGMGPNNGWYEYLPRIVECVHNEGNPESTTKHGLLYRLKKAIPWQWIRQITMRLPHSWNKALIPLWSRRMYDWSTTRYFALPMDYNGYIRLNIKGREAQGCLDPADVDREIERLEQGLKSFRDIKTGKPIVKGVQRIEEILDGESPARNQLPDLIVTWAVDFPTSESCGITSDAYGEIRWPEGEKLISGRSGNHTPNGWFLAAGPGIDPGATEHKYHSTDIVPTILHWMGARTHPRYQGEVIDGLRVE